VVKRRTRRNEWLASQARRVAGTGCLSRAQKIADFLKENRPSGILFKNEMVFARQADEARASYPSREFAATRHWHSVIVSDVHDEGWRPHFRQKMPNVEIRNGLNISNGTRLDLT
jgi:hypothetical protein